MKNHLFGKLWVILLLAACLAGTASAQMTVYLVRHAEKVTKAGDRNPSLTKAGQTRAEALAKTLRSAKISDCFSTGYARTQETAKPTADMAKTKVQTYQAGREKDFIAKLMKSHRGKNVLITGHSNTVPNMLTHLGIKHSITMTEKHYDDLFMVTVTKDGKATLTHLHYGAANPK